MSSAAATALKRPASFGSLLHLTSSLSDSVSRGASSRRRQVVAFVLVVGLAGTVVTLVLASMALQTRDETFEHMVIIDAGSSGSRVFVYRWQARGARLPTVELMQSRDSRPLIFKTEPGLSAFRGRPAEAVDSLLPLLQFANTYIAPSLRAATPLFVYATAGLRLLEGGHANEIISALQTLLHKHTAFSVLPEQIQLISGLQEGMSSWLAVNYIEGRLKAQAEEGERAAEQQQLATVGCLDMGGGSAQVAFETRAGGPKDAGTEVDLTPPGARRPLRFRTEVQTLLGFGANTARTRYLALLRQANQSTDPCLPTGMVNDWEAEEPGYQPLLGTGNYRQCRRALAPLLFDETTSCGQAICSLRRLPPLPLPRNGSWYGFSEYYYTHYDVLGLQGSYNASQFDAAASEFCRTDWALLEARAAQGLYPNAMPSRLRQQCFKAAWMTVMLHTGYGFPPSVNMTVTKLMRGTEVQWTLGQALLRATDMQRAAHGRGVAMPFRWLLASSMSSSVFLLLILGSAAAIHMLRTRLGSCRRVYNIGSSSFMA